MGEGCGSGAAPDRWGARSPQCGAAVPDGQDSRAGNGRCGAPSPGIGGAVSGRDVENEARATQRNLGSAPPGVKNSNRASAFSRARCRARRARSNVVAFHRALSLAVRGETRRESRVADCGIAREAAGSRPRPHHQTLASRLHSPRVPAHWAPARSSEPAIPGGASAGAFPRRSDPRDRGAASCRGVRHSRNSTGRVVRPVEAARPADAARAMSRVSRS